MSSVAGIAEGPEHAILVGQSGEIDKLPEVSLAQGLTEEEMVDDPIARAWMRSVLASDECYLV